MGRIDELVIGVVEHRSAKLKIPFAILEQHIKITLIEANGNRIEVPFARDARGPGAICLSITRSFVSHELKNVSEAATWDELRAKIPGAFMLSLRRKREIYRGFDIPLGKGPLHAMLSWNAAVEIDLHIWWQLGTRRDAGRYLLIPRTWRKGRVFFQKVGRRIRLPYVYLDLDESLDLAETNSYHGKVQCAQFLRPEALDRILLAAHVFGKPNANHGNYNTKLELVSDSEHVVIPIKDTEKGPWRLLAEIKRTPDGCSLRVLDQSCRRQPSFELI